jgi:thioesterase domain-containing protein/acyl carrier protein
LLNAYGSTECSDDVSHYILREAPGIERVHTPIGRPIINTQLYVLDRCLEPVPIEVAGELYVGGTGVGRGYLNDPKRTAEVFVPDPFTSHPGARLYGTGDRVRFLPSGDLEFLGRIEHEVKIRGFRIDVDRTGSFIGPRDTIEFAIAQIWEELLKLKPVGVRHDFFALGGHSLLAVQLMASIRERFGQVVPLGALFQNATVEALAQQLREGASPRPWSPLVPIQPGGPRRPVFLVHPQGGAALCYAALARHLGREWPVYGLQARGIEGDLRPLDRIEEMAASYVEAIRSVQREGPYALGGWSLGGLVAFEMAQQLKEAGHEVTLLALLDTNASGEIQDESWDDVSFLANMAAMADLEVSRDVLKSLSQDELRRYFLDLTHKGNVVPPGFDLPQLERWIQVYRAHHEAILRYKERPYPGPITVFRAKEARRVAVSQGVHVEREPDLGWGGLSPRPIEVHEVPGDHDSLVSEPHVVTLAERLRQCLLDAEQPTVTNPSQ